MITFGVPENNTNVAQASIVVNAPIAEAYQGWLRFEDLPKFIKPLRDVQRIDDTHFSFSAQDNGEEQEGVFEVMFRAPERRIAWRTIAKNVGLGVVSFEPRTAGSTEITLKLRSGFDPLLSAERAPEYLGAFKKWIESRLVDKKCTPRPQAAARHRTAEQTNRAGSGTNDSP